MYNKNRQTLFLRRKNIKTAETEDLIKYNNCSKIQPTQTTELVQITEPLTERNQIKIQQCNSEIQSYVEINDNEIKSDIETPAKSLMGDFIIKEFEIENSAQGGSGQKIQNRPTIEMMNDALRRKYYKKYQKISQDEILLYIMIGVFILNICLHEQYLYSKQLSYKKIIGLIIELITSIYYIYDSIIKQTIIIYERLMKFKKNQQEQILIGTIIDLISGPTQFIICGTYYFKYQQILGICLIMKSLKMFSTNFLRQHLIDTYNTLINSLPLIFASIVIFFVFTYLCTILYCDINKQYFKNISISAFTLLQVLTIDGWADITKQLMIQTGLEVVLLIFIFITLLGLFFWFLIQAFQIDVMILEQLVKEGKVDVLEQLNTQISYNTISQELYSLIFGKYCNRIVLTIWIIQLIFANFQRKLNNIEDIYYIFFIFFVSLLYLAHWISLIILKDTDVFNSYYTKIQLTFHSMAGPLSFISLLFEIIMTEQIQFSPILLMFKILTNSNIRDISYISLRVISYSYYPYILMVTLTIIVMTIINLIYHEHESNDFFSTIIIYLQLMTLDDLKATLQQSFVEKNRFFATFIVIIYVLICQFLLIPAFMAQACEMFQTILGVSFRPCLNQDDNLNIYKYQDSTVETIIKQQSPRLYRIFQSKNLIYQLLKYQLGIFSQGNKIHPALLTKVYLYLQKLQNIQYPKFETLTKNEKAIYYKVMPKQITLQFNNKSITIQSKSIVFVQLP